MRAPLASPSRWALRICSTRSRRFRASATGVDWRTESDAAPEHICRDARCKATSTRRCCSPDRATHRTRGAARARRWLRRCARLQPRARHLAGHADRSRIGAGAVRAFVWKMTQARAIRRAVAAPDCRASYEADRAPQSSALEPDGIVRMPDDWYRRKRRALRGHGSTRVLAGGDVFEKGGVNTSIVTRRDAAAERRRATSRTRGPPISSPPASAS